MVILTYSRIILCGADQSSYGTEQFIIMSLVQVFGLAHNILKELWRCFVCMHAQYQQLNVCFSHLGPCFFSNVPKRCFDNTKVSFTHLLRLTSTLVPVLIPSLISYDKLNSSFTEIIRVDPNKTLDTLHDIWFTLKVVIYILNSQKREWSFQMKTPHGWLLHYFMTYYGHDGLSCSSIYRPHSVYTFIHTPLIPFVCPALQPHCICWWSSL